MKLKPKMESKESARATSRHEKSLGLLTMKFVGLLRGAEDGVLDLKAVSGGGVIPGPFAGSFGPAESCLSADRCSEQVHRRPPSPLKSLGEGEGGSPSPDGRRIQPVKKNTTVSGGKRSEMCLWKMN